jgi:hypothetical protein
MRDGLLVTEKPYDGWEGASVELRGHFVVALPRSCLGHSYLAIANPGLNVSRRGCCSLHCWEITERHYQDVARLEEDNENDCRRGYVGRWFYNVCVLGPHRAREGWGEKQGPSFGRYTN